MKKFYISLAALAVVVSSIALFGFLNTNSEAAEPREDCRAGSDYNSIIKCGTLDAAELAKRYRDNDKGDLKAIYNSYGLSETEVTKAGTHAKMGRVYKDGKVKVGNKVVATNAQSLGRHNKPGSTKVTIGGKTYYERKNTSAFVVDSISAFVFFDKNGDFKAAILTACGNPVRADKPIYKCEDLIKKPISRNRFEFTAKAIAKDGAQVSSYTFDFGDGSSKKTTNKSVEHTFKPGTYTVKVTVMFKVNGYYEEKTGSQCKVQVTVPEPSYACKSLQIIDKVSRTEYKFAAKAEAANGAKVVSYKYDFGDGKKKDNASATETHKYSKPGTYTVKVWANIQIDGKYNREVTSEKCKVNVTVAPEAEYTCDYLKKKMITRTKYEFTGKATAANGPTITNYTIDFGDNTTAEVTDPTNVPHEYAEPGTYTAKMTANMVVNGQAKPVTSEKCEVEVTIVPPNKVEVCNPETGETIVVDEGDADNYVPVGDPACEPVEVCNPETGETITVDRKDQDKYKPVGDPACEEKPEECKPGIPVGDERCDECVPNPKGNDTCEEEIPAELPTTGPAETIGGIIGLGSLVAAGYYWYASRRGLMSEMLNR